MKREMRERGGSNICFDCKLSVGLCPWCEKIPGTKKIRWQPIEGWDAVKVPYPDGRGEWSETYWIKSCPMFVPDDNFEERVSVENYKICPLCGEKFLRPKVGQRKYCTKCVPEGYTYDKTWKRLVKWKRD